MKRILITGSNGFIGSHFVEEGLKQGYDVYAGVRTSSSRKFLTDPRINFFELGLSDKQTIKVRLIQSKSENGCFDYIIHNAGITKSKNKSDFEKINFQYTKNLVEALVETNCIPEKFIYISSLAAMGPGDETTMEPIRNADKPHPVSLYGKSKLKAEKFIQFIPELPWLIFRPTGVYGPREKDYLVMYKTISRHLETYIGTNKQHITFIYAKDLARLVINSLDSQVVRKSYFVTDGGEYTTKEFSEIVKHILKRKTISITFPKFIVKPISFVSGFVSSLFGKVATLNPEKYLEISQKNWLCDSNDLHKDFGFEAEYNLYEGLLETIDWNMRNKLL